MTTTSEKILSEMQRMGKIKINILCAKMGWDYQKWHRRMAPPGKFSDEELELVASSMNALEPLLPPTSVEKLRGDQLITFTGIDGTEYEIEVRVRPKKKE